MSHLLRARLRGSLLGALAALGVLAPGAQADTTQPVWDCRASAGRVVAPEPFPTVEPLVANGALDPFGRAQCVDDDAGQSTPLVLDDDGAPPSLTVQAPFARTRVDPDLAPARDQSTESASGVANAKIVAPDGSTFLEANVVQASATATCNDSTPAFAGTSTVALVTLAGNPIDPDAPLQEIAAGFNASPLGALAQIAFNEQTADGQSLTQRAVRVRFFAGDGQDPGATPISEVVVAEAIVGRRGDVCAPPAPLTCPQGTAPGPGGDACIRTEVQIQTVTQTQTQPGQTTQVGVAGSSQRRVCPNGSAFDAQRELCIIERGPGRGDDIVVGRIGDVPVGGTVVPIEDIRRAFGDSRCTRGAGPAFAIVGTSGADRITGTNRRDRIITFAGNDRVDGGRGGDCISGGSGRDILNGALGADTVVAGSGNDALNGGPGSDVLNGGSGNDTINAAYGRDRVTAGPGVDFVNVATAGPSARVNCGSGADKVRGNSNERRRTFNCEVRYFLR